MAIKGRNVAFDPKLFLSRVENGKTNAKYRANDAGISPGDAADAVFCLQKGNAKFAVLSESGKSGTEPALAILGAGDFFGEGCLNGQLRRIPTVNAMAACAIMRPGAAT